MSKLANLGDCMSREDAATYLGVSVDQIKIWIQKGKLRVVPYREGPGMQWRFMVPVADLDVLRDRSAR